VNFKTELETKIHEILAKPDLSEVLNFDEKLDLYFKIDIKKIEEKVTGHEDSIYPGLDPRALLTSYIDYYQILSDIPDGEELIDLGAGYCRGTILSEFLKLSKCKSIEIVESRVCVAQNCLKEIGADLGQIIKGDLLTIPIPKAYGYFLYYPKSESLYKIMRDLFEKSKVQVCYLYVCESHGDVIDYIEMFSTIKKVKEFKVSQPRHRDFIVKYEINPVVEKIEWQTHLPEWLLFNTNENISFTLKLKHSYFEDYVSWIIPTKEVELILYKGERSLYDKTGRIIFIEGNEPIENIEERTSSVNDWMQSNEFKKFIYHQGAYYQELSSGEIKLIKALR
jgi:hypothetical protein